VLLLQIKLLPEEERYRMTLEKISQLAQGGFKESFKTWSRANKEDNSN